MADHTFHPELRAPRFVLRPTVGPRTLWFSRLLRRLSPAAFRSYGAEVIRIDADVSVRVFRPASGGQPAPGLLWIHGGGYVGGRAAMDDDYCRDLSDVLGVVVASVDYRLAPEHPFPAPLEDCYTGLRWLAEQPDVDAARIAIGGASAGGGLAAALALLAKERGDIHPVFQLLSYPMLDDRTTERDDIDPRRLRLWNQKSNRFGWRSYLGPAAAGGAPPLAAPARYEDLSGLPPTWLGVGTNDLFHDEDVAYAARLEQAGVPCTLHVVPGAYHAFDRVEATVGISQEFRQAQVAALDGALNGSTLP